jgi:hypothetical protein
MSVLAVTLDEDEIKAACLAAVLAKYEYLGVYRQCDFNVLLMVSDLQRGDHSVGACVTLKVSP